jgi:hypothetical protein
VQDVNIQGRREMHIGFWWENQEEDCWTRRCTWDDNVKMGIREVGLLMEWIHLAPNGRPVESSRKNGNDSLGFIKCLINMVK